MMMNTIDLFDLGVIDYKDAWNQQQSFFDALHLQKVQRGQQAANVILFCEHPHVYTLGKSGQSANLLIPDEFLKTIGASFYKIDRGGDITYHGPGQLVGYPIIDLEAFNVSLKEYISKIEDVVILTIAEYGIKGERLEGATGVWIDASIPGKARKICAIGVKASRFITMHGFALNVNTNLDYFGYINPCGFVDKGVTSMQKELGFEVNFLEVKERIRENFEKVFGTKVSAKSEEK